MSGELVQAGIEHELEPDINSPMATLTYIVNGADDGSNEDDLVVDLWTLDGEDEQRPIRDHPNSRTLNTASAGIILKIDEQIEQFQKDSISNPSAEFVLDPVSIAGLTSGQQALAQSYVDAILRGADQYSASRWVLRNTKTVSPMTSVRPVMNNVNRIYTTAQLISDYSIPNTILFTLPAGFWLKRTPEVEQLSNGKFQIRQEFVWSEEYSTYLYQPKT